MQGMFKRAPARAVQCSSATDQSSEDLLSDILGSIGGDDKYGFQPQLGHALASTPRACAVSKSCSACSLLQATPAKLAQCWRSSGQKSCHSQVSNRLAHHHGSNLHIIAHYCCSNHETSSVVGQGCMQQQLSLQPSLLARQHLSVEPVRQPTLP